MNTVRIFDDDKAAERLERIEKAGLAKNGGPPYDGDMEHRITALETRLDTILPTLATKADVAELKTDIHKNSADIIKWVVGTGFAGFAAFIVVITFVLNNAVPKSAPVGSLQPIIINVPAAPTK